MGKATRLLPCSLVRLRAVPQLPNSTRDHCYGRSNMFQMPVRQRPDSPRSAAQRWGAGLAAASVLVWSGLAAAAPAPESFRSEEQTSELQSLMRNSYAVFCLKKKNKQKWIY